MPRFRGRLWGKERGQALAIVLALLAIGGLTIAVSLNYATTNLKGGAIVKEKTSGAYAAAAGVEYVLWALPRGGMSMPEGATTSNTTPGNINQMAVGIQTQNKGTKTLVLTGWSALSTHYNYVSVTKSITWDEAAGAYRYTVNITLQAPSGEPKVFLSGLGVRIPSGFSYQSSPAPSGMSTAAPAISGAIGTGYTFNWSWSGGSRPYLWATDTTTVQSQTFYVSGSGDTGGSYAWVVADRADIGTVGEITGTLYRITSNATRPQDGRVSGKIVADVMVMGGTSYIISWQTTVE